MSKIAVRVSDFQKKTKKTWECVILKRSIKFKVQISRVKFIKKSNPCTKIGKRALIENLIYVAGPYNTSVLKG